MYDKEYKKDERITQIGKDVNIDEQLFKNLDDTYVDAKLMYEFMATKVSKSL